LQDLIETLKKQGVESGEAASRQIVADAEKQASEKISQANKEADNIVNGAKQEAERILKQLHSSMEIAASQFLTNLKQQIETDLLTLPLKGKLTEILADTSFLKELIATCVQGFVQGPGEADLTLLVSKDQRDRLKDFAVQLITQMGTDKGDNRLNLTLQTNSIAYGFIVGKTDGRVMLDFSGEAFLDLFLRYLSPKFHAYFKIIDFKNTGLK
jgi:V/A-type H+-transporting ATPase subunit E